jgi:hypothetical protein
MPKGRLYDWEGIATMERQNPETRWVESSSFDAQKTVPVPIMASDQLAHHRS